jgi:quinoprotein glucose dehydrogenase
VIDGVMYVQAKNNSLVALDAMTGKELWTHPFTGPVVQRGINLLGEQGPLRRPPADDQRRLPDRHRRAHRPDRPTFGDNGRTDLRAGLDFDWSTIAPIHTNNPG